MEQATDFLNECEALEALLRPLQEDDFDHPTQFKGWTVTQVMQHLFFFDRLAGYSIVDNEAFDRDWQALSALRQDGVSFTKATDIVLDGLNGKELLAAWAQGYRSTAAIFARTDPKVRVKWVGPGMSARSSITARLMETWSHAQAIYDMLGVERDNKDRIRNIVVLGVNTFAWTFQNRNEEVPAQMPFLELTAPSGAVWTWGEPQGQDQITGQAEDFCMVVTQTRNIKDTKLEVRGDVATRWMAVAQCFAGPPRTPPAPGTRYKQV